MTISRKGAQQTLRGEMPEAGDLQKKIPWVLHLVFQSICHILKEKKNWRKKKPYSLFKARGTWCTNWLWDLSGTHFGKEEEEMRSIHDICRKKSVVESERRKAPQGKHPCYFWSLGPRDLICLHKDCHCVAGRIPEILKSKSSKSPGPLLTELLTTTGPGRPFLFKILLLQIEWTKRYLKKWKEKNNEENKLKIKNVARYCRRATKFCLNIFLWIQKLDEANLL